MPDLGHTLARLPVTTAFLAGAAILAGSGMDHAALAQGLEGSRRSNDDLAMAVPRLSLPDGSRNGGNEIALPQPLPLSEGLRIRRILNLQAHGAIEAAARETELLDTGTLLGQAMLGHILADRYLGRFTRPGPAELRAWLTRWPDLPEASAIHALLIVRLPRNAALPAAPQQVALPSAPLGTLRQPPVPEETGAAVRALSRNPALDRAVADAARRRGSGAVLRLLDRTSGLTPAYASQLAGEAGQILFTLSRDAEAYEVAAAGVRACGRWGVRGAPCQVAALSGYAAGLAAWRMGRIDQARFMFETAWHAPLTTPSLRAGAALWAARTRFAVQDVASAGQWLTRAAAERNTFYGLIARRSLGLGVGGTSAGDDAARETLGEADVDAVAATPEGLRAFALLQAGERGRAEAELRRLWPAMQATHALARAVMLIADAADMPELAAQLADLLQAEDGRVRDGTRFRIPRLRPDGGFRIDPAMVYALARTESNFDPAMVSDAGATGMMQIMPQTANFIVGGRRSLSHGRLRAMLNDPGTNLSLGQRYVAYLARHEVVGGNLIRLLASYNSGPGSFARWSAPMRDQGDPLLFIEAIPVDETRAFVPRVLTYTWIYARRLRLPTPSLDELAGGAWPRYHPLIEAAPDAPPPARLH